MGWIIKLKNLANKSSKSKLDLNLCKGNNDRICLHIIYITQQNGKRSTNYKQQNLDSKTVRAYYIDLNILMLLLFQN